MPIIAFVTSVAFTCEEESAISWMTELTFVTLVALSLHMPFAYFFTSRRRTFTRWVSFVGIWASITLAASLPFLFIMVEGTIDSTIACAFVVVLNADAFCLALALPLGIWLRLGLNVTYQCSRIFVVIFSQ